MPRRLGPRVLFDSRARRVVHAGAIIAPLFYCGEVSCKQRQALERESGDVRVSTCDALGLGSDEWAACRAELVEQLQDAQDWVEKEEVLRTVDDAPVDSDDGPDFVPANQTLALVQSAMEEELDRGPHRRFFPRDPKWLSVLYQRLRSRARGKAPFSQHAHASEATPSPSRDRLRNAGPTM